MAIVAVPYHLDERLDDFSIGMPADHEVIVHLPRGTAWTRMAVLYEQLASVVGDQTSAPLVISGDCTTSLGTLAGLQRAGHDVGIVWLDAHADFHTEATTTSGYLGGLPLALAAGVGTLTLPAALGLHAVPESRIVLVDARDTDPGEVILLSNSSVARVGVLDLDDACVPSGELYLHIDIDVCDPADVPDLLYPVPGGPDLEDVFAAVQRVVETGRVAAVGIAATWHHNSATAAVHQSFLRRLARVVTK